MKGNKNTKILDEIGLIGSQPKKRITPIGEKKIAAKTRKAMDDYRHKHLDKKKAA